MSGTLYGVGLGPGDQDLMSVRADRLVRGARHVAYFRKAGRPGQARRLVEGMLAEDAIELPMEYPVTTEIPVGTAAYNACLRSFYEEATERLKALLDAGDDVVVLCEGDPFFYGSFMHLYTRLSGDRPVEVVPGITGMSAAWTATGRPVTWGDDIMTVLMGTLPEETLSEQMVRTDALVVMKLGRNLEKVKRALRAANRFEAAYLIEYAAMAEERVTRLADAGDCPAPYFSIIVVHGNGRRP